MPPHEPPSTPIPEPKLARRLALARDAATSTEQLQKLARGREKALRRAVAANPSTPSSTLAALLADFPDEVTGNDAWPLALLCQPQLDDEARRALARGSRSAATLAALADRPELYPSLLENPSLPPALLARLLVPDDWRVWTGVAQHPHCTPELLGRLAESHWSSCRVAVARNERTPPGALLRLARSDASGERWAVAQNPSTPPEALLLLAGDKEASVRYHTAQHPSSPPEALAEILRHGCHREIWFLLARHPSTPPNTLAQLATREKPGRYALRCLLAAHPNAPAELLEQLAGYNQLRVRAAAASHPALPPPARQRLLDDRSEDVRRAARLALRAGAREAQVSAPAGASR